MIKRTVAVLKWTGLTLIVLGVVYAALYIAASLSLRHEYAALKAAGHPMKWDEIVPSKIPDSDNAALLYDAAVKLLQSEPPVALASYAAPAAQVTENARMLGLTGLL